MLELTQEDIINLKKNFFEYGPIISDEELARFNALKLIATQSNDIDSLAYCEYYFAMLYYRNQEYYNSSQSLKKAAYLAEQLETCNMLPRIYNLLGGLQDNSNDISSAIVYYIKGLNYASRINDRTYMCATTNNIGRLFLDINEYSHALPYFLSAIELSYDIRNDNIRNTFSYVITCSILKCEMNLRIYDNLEQRRNTLELLATLANSKLYNSLNKIFDLVLAFIKDDNDESLTNFDEYITDINQLIQSPIYEWAIELNTALNILLFFTNLLMDSNRIMHAKQLIDILSATNFDTGNIRYETKIITLRIKIYEKISDTNTINYLYKDFYTVYLRTVRTNNLLLSKAIAKDIRLTELESHNTEFEIWNKKLTHITTTDELTNLYNRRHLNKCLAEARNFESNNKSLGIIIFDIDEFKQYNDTHGHIIGDHVLRSFANCLRTNNPNHMYFRYGGDEFIVLCQNVSNNEIINYIDSVYTVFEEANILTSCNLANHNPTFSAGFYNTSINEDVDSLILYADRALYRAKSIGKNTYCNYSDIMKDGELYDKQS